MCGITGYYSFNSDSGEVTTNTIRAMMMLQKHRGPDDSGISGINTASGYFQNTKTEIKDNFKSPVNLLFGFNRLSILDLSINGHQPMFSEKNDVLIMLNGEIYNAFDYKDSLQQKGYVFKSTTDTEVALNLYVEYGIDGMLERLNGMFAIVIYDFRTKKLYLTRDRFGIKPFYIIKQENRIAFSSEIKSFKALPDFKFELDESKIPEFLLYRYVVKDTLLKGIVSCTPGSYWEISQDGSTNIRQYYDINREGLKVFENSSVDEILETELKQSVKRQMISDVKLGCQLSGGVDSSVVSYYASEITGSDKLETFSIIFNDPDFSEKKYIDRVVKQLGLFPHQFTLTDSVFFDSFRDVTWHFENPVSHPNMTGIYALSREAKKHVSVLLSGEGADECFAGYSHFIPPLSYRGDFLETIFKLRKRKYRNLDYLLYQSGYDNLLLWQTAFGSLEAAKKVYPKFKIKDAISERKSVLKNISGSGLLKHRKYELLTYLPELLLRQDKMSMAHSIENRVPFLDNEIISVALNISQEKLVGQPNGVQGEVETKVILKDLCAKQFDKEFAYRDKCGFGIPEIEFINSNVAKDMWNDSIRDGIKNRGIFDIESIDEMMKNNRNLDWKSVTTLYLMFGFEVWAQLYLD